MVTLALMWAEQRPQQVKMRDCAAQGEGLLLPACPCLVSSISGGQRSRQESSVAASVARAEAPVHVQMSSWPHWAMQVLTWFCRGQALRQGTSRGALTAATAAPVAAFPSASSSTPAACR